MGELITIQLVYAACCIVLAWLNYRTIKKDLSVKHYLNGIIHIILWCFSILFYEHILMFVLLPLIGRVVFDVALNLMRKKDWNYVSEWVKAGDKRSSKIDKIEWKIFKSGGLPKIVYMATVIIINILL